MVHAHHLYPVLVDVQSAGISRNELQRSTPDARHRTSVHFPSCTFSRIIASVSGSGRACSPWPRRCRSNALAAVLPCTHRCRHRSRHRGSACDPYVIRCKGCKACRGARGATAPRRSRASVAAPLARVLFRAAAGPRRGFGHLLRCRALARALGVRPLVCVRGPRAKRGCGIGLWLRYRRWIAGPPAACARARRARRRRSDPIGAASWIAAARRAGVAVGEHSRPRDRLPGRRPADRRQRHRDHPSTQGQRSLAVPHLPSSIPISSSATDRSTAAKASSFRLAADLVREWLRDRRRSRGAPRKCGFGLVVSFLPAAARREKAPSNVVWVGPSSNLARRAWQSAGRRGWRRRVALRSLCPRHAGRRCGGGRRTAPDRGWVRGAWRRTGPPPSRIIPQHVADDALALLGQKRLRQVRGTKGAASHRRPGSSSSGSRDRSAGRRRSDDARDHLRPRRHPLSARDLHAERVRGRGRHVADSWRRSRGVSAGHVATRACQRS